MANSWASDVVVLPVSKDFSMVIVLPISTSADIGRAVVNAIKAMNRVDGPAQIQVA